MTDSNPIDLKQMAEWLRATRLHDQRPLQQILGEHQLDGNALVELVGIDIVTCYRLGRKVSVESYLAAFPLLVNDPEAVLDLIDVEVCVRREQGETVPVQELMNRFPAFASQLMRMAHWEELEHQLTETSFPEVNLRSQGDHSLESHSQGDHDRGAANSCSSSASSVDFSLAPTGRSPKTSSLLDIDGEPLEPPEGVRIIQLVASRLESQLYRALSVQDRRPLALKVIRQSCTDAFSPHDWLDRMELASTLKNPCFVSPEAVVANRHHYIIVRGWVEGTNWSAWATRSGGVERLLEPLAMIANAVHTAHVAMLPHGHIHPGNLLIDHRNQFRLTDLGSAAVSPHMHDFAPTQDDLRSADLTVLQTRDIYALTVLILRALERHADLKSRRWNHLYQRLQEIRSAPHVASAELLATMLLEAVNDLPKRATQSPWLTRWREFRRRSGETP